MEKRWTSGGQTGRARRAYARVRAQGGFTLVEALVASSLAMLLLGATAGVLVSGQVDANSVISTADAVQMANSGLRQMDQDLRQAYEVEYPTSTSHSTAGCTAVTSGAQSCNQLDVLIRWGANTDYEIRYDCAVASTTITTDQSCWRYQCAASASTPSNSSCLATTSGVVKRLVIDDLINGTTSSQVFSLCYASGLTTGAACVNGATRPTSGTVTIKVPAAGALSKASNGDPATVLLSDGIFMPNLSYGQ